jgi:signal transduction histidine kinase
VKPKTSKAASARIKPKPAKVDPRKSQTALVARLRAENRALKKSIHALMDRVERAVDEQGSAFSWFQAAATLEETIRQRTEQYESLNARLKRELESRRAIELALKQAKELADRANETKTRFLAAASHDLRQPLSSALLFLESMDERAVSGVDRDYLQKARVALASLSNLLGTLLDVARLDSGSIEPQFADFPVSAVLDRIMPEFEGVARSAGIDLRFSSSSVWVHSDMYLLETVLRNLISNAIRYTPTGKVLVGCRRRRDGLVVAVHDTGIGIDAEHLEAIFKAYYQVPAGGRGRPQGIGLGLSIVDRISRLLQLEREVRSRPGRGSMFAVKVHLARKPGRKVQGRLAARRGTPHGEMVLRSLTIVVIDDDAGVRQGLVATLAKWGHRALPAESATDAVVRLIAADLTPDLVISDYHLAGGTKGDAAIEEVSREFDRPPASIMMTSDPDPRLHEQLRTRGVPLLPKPLNPSRLRAQLARIAARQ